MVKSTILLLTLLVLASLASTAQGSSREMYRWTDENGVVHFTDQRPPGQDVTVIQVPSGTDSSPNIDPSLPRGEGPPANAGASGEDISAAEARRREIAERREERRIVREENERVCAEKRTEVERLEPHRRVFFTNEQGEVERMDDVVRTDRVAEAKAYIAENCE